MRSDFQVVKQVSNWGYWDELDGKTLVNGEVVEVKYPDGTIERGRVEVESRSIYISDMGNGYTGTDSSAYICFELHGADVKLGLRGMYARRVS